MKCPYCQQNVQTLIEAPPGSKPREVCKPCARFMWARHDKEQGLDLEEKQIEKRTNRRHRYEPTDRHERVAEIARELGANVTKNDVKIICAATRIEYEERTGKVAAGGISRHGQRVCQGLQ